MIMRTSLSSYLAYKISMYNVKKQVLHKHDISFDKTITSRCLKITEKVSFNITFTFWVDKSSVNRSKMVNFGEFLKTWSLRSNSVTRQVNFNRTKIGGKCQNSKIQMRHLGNFQTMWTWWTSNSFAPFMSLDFGAKIQSKQILIQITYFAQFPTWMFKKALRILKEKSRQIFWLQ